jgi:hypothetical protein
MSFSQTYMFQDKENRITSVTSMEGNGKQHCILYNVIQYIKILLSLQPDHISPNKASCKH